MAYAEPTGKKRYLSRYKDATGKSQSVKGEDGRPVRFPASVLPSTLARSRRPRSATGLGPNPRLGQLTFSSYVEELWLPNRVLEVNTASFYEDIYKAPGSLKDEFGDVVLNRIRYEQVQGWVTRMVQADVSPGLVKTRFKALQTILVGPAGGMSAMKSRLIEVNPCQGIDLPTVVKREVTIYEPEEVDASLDVMDPYWAPIPLVASEVGIRWGELMGLQTTDFSVGMRTQVAFTVGRTLKDRPELFMVGNMSHQVMAGAPNRLVEMDDRDPLVLHPGLGALVLDGAMGGYTLRLVPADPVAAELNVALRFFAEGKVTALQVLWHDPQGRYPGDPGFPEGQQPTFPL